MSDVSRHLLTIFGEALECVSPAEQAAYLDRTCGSNAEMRARIEVLLRAHQKAGDFLQGPPAPADRGPAEGPGTVIGPYKLVEPIGEGGFGIVFLAEQNQPVRRRVALKVVKPGMDSRQIIARFEAERQALALMDHPHIARVFDAGETVTGRPYFVMELVRGIPLTDFCDQNRLTPRERLQLFVSVCQAVQHAHQKGIIHRDLKPSNVLVTLHDGVPVVKVIDFGIAKAIDQRLTDKTLVTGFAQIVGTPLYMSPEQAELSGLDIDTRSDIYSLGVLLYELLTGTTPFDKDRLREVSFDELRRILREEEPPKPSTRVSTLGEAAATVSEKRQTDPKRLGQLMRGELDWIVMKCLEKDRTRRYETASALARDVERYLHDEPVEACPPSVGYRLGKFLRRHKGPVLAATLLVLTLLAGGIGTTVGLVQARKALESEADQRIQAEQQRDRALQAEELAQKRLVEATDERAVAAAVKDFLQNDLLRQADSANQLFRTGLVERNPKVTVRELVDRAAGAVEGRFPGQPLTEAAIRQVLADTYRGLGEYDLAQPHAERAIALFTAKRGNDHPDTLVSKNNLATLYLFQAKYNQAEKLFQEILQAKPAKLRDGPSHLLAKHNLAGVYLSRKEYGRAEALFQEVLQARTAEQGADHPHTLSAKHNLATVYQNQKKYDRAATLFQEVVQARTATLGANHLDTLVSKGMLASMYQEQKQYDMAEAILQEVIQGFTAQRGKDHPHTLTAKSRLGTLYWRMGRFQDAVPLAEEVLRGMQRNPGADHPDTARAAFNLAVNYRDTGRLNDAEAVIDEWLPRCRTRFGLDHPTTQTGIRTALSVYWLAKKPTKAEALLRDLVDFRKAKSGADSPEYAAEVISLVHSLFQQRKSTDAEPILRECLAAQQKKSPDLWNTSYLRSLLGFSLLQQQKYAEAEPLLVQGYEGMKRLESQAPASARANLTDSLRWLVQLYDATDQKDKAAACRTELEARKGAEKK